MEGYFKLALLLGSVYMAGCQVQQMTELTIHNLLTRVRDLEIAVKQLVEIQNSQAGNSYTNTITPTTALPDVPLPLNMLEGFTLGNSGDEKGFHVTLDNDVTVGYGNKIKFDRIVENMGGAYNKVNSEFTCPTSGTYLLSLNIACERDSYLVTNVEIRNEKGPERDILNSVCDHRKRTLSGGRSLYCGRTQNGGTAIVSLKKGEKVSVKKLWPFGDSSTISGNGLSTFSGYLLRHS
ncbi:uncharacterized protein LOC132745283 isoform X2 [Ruditapes philippinarum]|nr:uncharacterized protein LOC132745283 isoform X2 [Ruditapes philippinarum]XP_060590144.1 uncharacterized protein LOC132745283 isoform X2 [Ruditapes philippinarum]